MNIPEELLAKIRKDWENEEIEAVGDFQTYLAGYIACLKRFGGVGYLPKNLKSAKVDKWQRNE